MVEIEKKSDESMIGAPSGVIKAKTVNKLLQTEDFVEDGAK